MYVVIVMCTYTVCVPRTVLRRIGTRGIGVEREPRADGRTCALGGACAQVAARRRRRRGTLHARTHTHTTDPLRAAADAAAATSAIRVRISTGCLVRNTPTRAHHFFLFSSFFLVLPYFSFLVFLSIRARRRTRITIIHIIYITRSLRLPSFIARKSQRGQKKNRQSLISTSTTSILYYTFENPN